MDDQLNLTTVERRLFDMARPRGIPINGSIELLPLCNMNCDMCYVRLSAEEMKKQGRMRTADEWLALAQEMKRAGTLFLLLTGGEPLVYPDFRRLYLALKDMGMILTVNTNATLIDESWAAFFGAHKPRRINVTLYGADEETYANLCHYPGGFEKTLRGVRLLRQNDVDVRLGFSVTKENVPHIDRMYEIAAGLDVPVNVDTYMLPATREREKPFAQQSRILPEEAARIQVDAVRRGMAGKDFKEHARLVLAALDQIAQGPRHDACMHCLAGKCSFTINWQGKMRPCVILGEPEADVFEMGFAAAWDAIRKSVSEIRTSEECAACAMRPICQTCAASALYETGSFDGKPEYLCRMSDELIRLFKEAAK